MAEGERVSGEDTDPGVSRRSRGAVTQCRGDDGSRVGGTTCHGGWLPGFLLGTLCHCHRGWKGSPRPRSSTEDPTETPPPSWRGLCPTRSTPNSCPRRAALIAWGILSVLGGTFVCGQSAALAVMGLLH